MRVTVIGAGYVGLRTLKLLGPDRGIAFGRSPVDGFASYLLDLDSDPLALPTTPRSLFYTVPPAGHAADDPRLARLLAALPEPPERVVYLSTSGVYGDCGGAMVSESSVPAPTSDRARRRYAAEQMLQAWCAQHGSRCIIFRVPGIYGPGRLGVERISAGEPYICEQDAGPGNRIHVDDLAAAAFSALTRNIPAGLYNIGDGDNRSSTWLAQTVAALLGWPAPPLVSRAEALLSFPASRLSFLTETRVLDTRKMRDVLGFAPRYVNAEEGIRTSLAADGLLPL